MTDNTFFFAKLVNITQELSKYKKELTELNHLINIPIDNKTRYVICSPMVNKLLRPEDAPYDTRLRIALPNEPAIAHNAYCFTFEVYQNGILMSSTPLTALNDDQASAIEAEIYNYLLKKNGLHISLL